MVQVVAVVQDLQALKHQETMAEMVVLVALALLLVLL
jgi:tellurite resistance protein